LDPTGWRGEELAVKIALAQINPIIGAFAANCRKICDLINRAKREGCDLVVFPELALTGSPPQGLLADPAFVKSSQAYWEPIIQASRSLGVICGVVASNPKPWGMPYQSSALFCADGVIKALKHKRSLSAKAFDGGSPFEPADGDAGIDFKGKRISLSFGEELFEAPSLHFTSLAGEPDAASPSTGERPDILIAISAYTYIFGNHRLVQERLSSLARSRNQHLVWVNQVGGNDSRVFQGHSLALDRVGQICLHGADFEEDVLFWETTSPERDRPKRLSEEAEVLAALRLGIRDYSDKCGYTSALVSLSGDVGSAVTACLAKLVYGRNGVRAVVVDGGRSVPNHSAGGRMLADRLGIPWHLVTIEQGVAAVQEALASLGEEDRPSFGAPSLAARLSGVVLAAYRESTESLLLLADECFGRGTSGGSLLVLRDVPGSFVSRLAEFISSEFGWIPRELIEGIDMERRQALEAEHTGIPESLHPTSVPKEPAQSVLCRAGFGSGGDMRPPTALQVFGRASAYLKDIPLAHQYRPER